MAKEEETTRERLTDKVLQEARQEAAKIISDAEAAVAERRKSLERRIRDIEEEATRHIEAERERLSRRADAAIAQAEGRKRLTLESRLYQAVEEGAVEALEKRRSAPGYPELLAAWILEAAEGLGEADLLVGFSPEDEDVGDAAIAQATKALSDRGWGGSLRRDPGIEVTGQGVVVRDAPGRKAYCNTVADRVRRKRQDVYRIAYKQLVEDRDD